MKRIVEKAVLNTAVETISTDCHQLAGKVAMQKRARYQRKDDRKEVVVVMILTEAFFTGGLHHYQKHPPTKHTRHTAINHQLQISSSISVAGSLAASTITCLTYRTTTAAAKTALAIITVRAKMMMNVMST